MRVLQCKYWNHFFPQSIGNKFYIIFDNSVGDKNCLNQNRVFQYFNAVSCTFTLMLSVEFNNVFADIVWLLINDRYL